ncbi:MAG: site-2 protease family protein [Clostridia bacterium]|nr:site-2 protease family protein [Clostridia bacterium]
MFRNISSWISSFQRNPLGTLIEIIMMIAALLLSLILHEMGHAVVALKCGDPTAKMMGRISLDPRKHLDPIGMISMFFLGIGWAKPVPINPYNFRHRERDMILVSFAGIFVNLILFLFSTFLYVLLYRSGGLVVSYVQEFLMILLSYNISLAVFNLVPVPPLDGYRLVNQIFFKGRLDYSTNAQTMQIIHYGFLFLCLSGVLSSTFSRVCNFFMINAANLFAGMLNLGFKFV